MAGQEDSAELEAVYRAPGASATTQPMNWKLTCSAEAAVVADITGVVPGLEAAVPVPEAALLN